MAVITHTTVIEHLAQATVGHRIRSAAGELIKHLLVVEDQYTEAVILLMQGSHTLCLFQIGSRGEDNHVGGRLGMDILVNHLTHQLRMGK